MWSLQSFATSLAHFAFRNAPTPSVSLEDQPVTNLSNGAAASMPVKYWASHLKSEKVRSAINATRCCVDDVKVAAVPHAARPQYFHRGGVNGARGTSLEDTRRRLSHQLLILRARACLLSSRSLFH